MLRTNEVTRPSRIAYISADKLTVFPEAQRDAPSKASVSQIVRSYQPDGLGVMHVNHRGDGVYSLVDGQRRVAALRSMGLESQSCECKVYEGLSIGQEAELFRMLNRTRKSSAYDDFSKGITAGDPECVAITRVCEESGYRVGHYQARGTVICIRSLQKVWRSDGNGALLCKTLSCLGAIFDDGPRAVSANLVEGLAIYFASEPTVGAVKFVEKAKARFSSPDSLIARARARRDTEAGSLASHVAYIFGKAYSSRKLRI